MSILAPPQNFASPKGRAVDHDRLKRLERIANGLDSAFRIPGTRFRFGWDSMLGLIPGVGDVATLLPGAYIIVEAWRLGARKRTLARMCVNSTADVVLGTVPVLGDAVDAVFKANQRNLRLLKADLHSETPLQKEKYHG
ncbi:DUF4112 domain-containing protein [Marivita sp. S6314]|uniref:DUF4112 domain-containing protein n=1 Tax=Marivita sp. S6314 TaxID=2926406 RepID=UPI001FF1B975|nr:DUF4112 domain-containing protein [Marivita sp. S6314]MCK0150063.1 DUF4112 domain-containing protein [Marivita sp. S6314]